MTTNQINYWNLQENKRHNVVTEGETNRHNVATETETNRHNLATEAVDLGKLNESIRHNQRTEQISAATLAETNRHNVVSEGEANRHNVQTERLDSVDLNIKQDQLGETQRHNQQTESVDKMNAHTSAVVGQSERLRNDAETQYKEVLTTWEGLKNSPNVDLANAKVKAVQQQLKQIDSQIQRAQIQNTVDAWNAVNNSVRAAADIIDALIPG